jgi:replicative DNA helicase
MDKIGRLIENIALRREMGLAGRKTVEIGYSVNSSAPKFLDVIREVAK